MSVFLVHPEFIGSISNQLLWEYNIVCYSDVEDLVFFYIHFTLRVFRFLRSFCKIIFMKILYEIDPVSE